VMVGHHRQHGQAAQADRRVGAATEECGVGLGLTLTTPPSRPVLYHSAPNPIAAWASQVAWAADKAALWSVA
jgi:hypothetical protein